MEHGESWRTSSEYTICKAARARPIDELGVGAMEKRGLIALVIVLCAAYTSSFAQTEIGDIQNYLPTGEPNSPYIGQSVNISGVVTYGQYEWSRNSRYVQDPTSGILVISDFFYDSTIGDYLDLTGVVVQVGGALALDLAAAPTLISSGTSLSPVALTPEEAMSGFDYIGELVVLSGVVGLSDFVERFYLVGTMQGILVYCNSDARNAFETLIPGDPYTVTGVLGHPGASTFELYPRFAEDIVPDSSGTLASDLISWDGVKSLYR